ncbi:MAG TPA: serine hydrolase [Cyclobacteriaceae bacterium]
MTSRVLIYLFASLILLSCHTKPTIDDLKKQVTTESEKNQGQFAVAFKDLTTGEELLINAHELFHAASTMKTPVMMEAYKQAEEGKFSLNDSILIKNEFKSIVDSSLYSLEVADDSDTVTYKHLGEKTTISSLIYSMITVSSNLATNILIEKVDAKKVTQSLRDIGAKDIKVLRGVEDNKAFQAGLSNEITAYDLMLVFERLGKGEVVSAKASEEMIGVLLDQKYNTIIPAKLPAEVKVAHKTGWIKKLNHDSGLVILPDGRKYVLILLSAKTEDEQAAIESMTTVSKMIYDYETKK